MPRLRKFLTEGEKYNYKITQQMKYLGDLKFFVSENQNKMSDVKYLRDPQNSIHRISQLSRNTFKEKYF